MSGSDLRTVGGKFSYRMKKQVGGNWAFADNRLMTDKTVNDSQVHGVIEDAWSQQPEVYRSLRGIELDPEWIPSPYAKARFVTNIINAHYHRPIQDLLADRTINLSNLRIEREHEIHPWDVHGTPAVSISITSRLIL